MSETIVTGKKYRILTDVAQKVWQRVSFWTKSSDVEFNDGKTAETKVGAISGITDSLVSNSSNIAASAKAVSELNGNIKVYVDEEGQLHFVNGSGADSVIPFSNAVDLGDISASSQSSAGSRDSTFDLSTYIGYSDISADDIIFMPLEWGNTAIPDANLVALQTPTVKNYDNTTGIVTLQGMSGRNYIWGATITKAHFVILK